MLAQISCDGDRDNLKPGGPKRDPTLTQLSFFKTFARGRTGSVAPCFVGPIGTVGALVTSVSPMHTPPTLNTAKLIWGTSRFVYEINKKTISENQQFAVVSVATVFTLTTILFITSVTTVIFQITEKVHRNTHSAICTSKLRNWITRCKRKRRRPLYENSKESSMITARCNLPGLSYW